MHLVILGDQPKPKMSAKVPYLGTFVLVSGIFQGYQWLDDHVQITDVQAMFTHPESGNPYYPG